MVLTFIAALALMKQSGTNVNSNVGYELTSFAFTSGSSFATLGLATVDTSSGDGDISLTNNSAHTSTSAAVQLTYKITWSPSTAGQTPPSSLVVSVGRNYSLTASGNGSCSLKSPSGAVIDTTVGGANLVANGGTNSEVLELDTVTMSAQLDGTATGTLVVQSSTLAASYDTTDGIATSTGESIFLVDFTLPTSPSPMIALVAKRSKGAK